MSIAEEQTISRTHCNFEPILVKNLNLSEQRLLQMLLVQNLFFLRRTDVSFIRRPSDIDVCRGETNGPSRSTSLEPIAFVCTGMPQMTAHFFSRSP